MGIWIMHTNDGYFYPITPSNQCKPEDHGEINDHVFRITDEMGRTLWMREPVKDTIH